MAQLTEYLLATTTMLASNNTQAVMLAKLPNMFEEINHVRCFNHTLNSQQKTLSSPSILPLLMAEMITLRTMFQILKKSTMKRVQRMVARMMMMVMTIEMMTVTQTLHSTLVVQMMESMSCRVVRGFGQTHGFCHVGPRLRVQCRIC